MNKRTKKIAKDSGFVLWKDEAWGPGAGKIDWSSNYDNEIEIYTKLIVQETVKWINKNVGLVSEEARKDLNKHFGVN